MTEAERVADLMDVSLKTVAIQGCPGIPVRRDLDVRRRDDAVGPAGIGLSHRVAARIFGIAEGDLSAAGHFLKVDADDVGPFLKGSTSEVLLSCGQRMDVDR